jgi:tetratricopeptide (TPR) repeat protein
MEEKIGMAVRKSATPTTSFFEHLKQVLESFGNAEWLGVHSPLAAPYFLGDAILHADATPLGRGEALRAQVDHVLETMWGGPLPQSGQEMLDAVYAEEAQGGRYDCLILELNYLKRRWRPVPRNQSEIYNDILHISRPTHDRHLRAAVDRLGTLLLRRLRPAVRPEQPMVPPLLIGRDVLQAQILHELTASKAVSLIGPGGVGKTSLAAALADAWNSPAIFWYTFRPTFNDQLESLLFALGHFLHRQGASLLWHQLVADGGRIKEISLALGLARSDLNSLPNKPLLCFDELDFLRPLTHLEAKPNHIQILEFLDSLRGHTALLMIGQRAFWESDAIYPLDGFTAAQLGELLTALSIPHSAEDAVALCAYTAGNLRLAELCIAFYQANTDATFADIFDQLPQFHGLLPLWLRLERRLPPAERQMLQILSVFRTAAPADVWQKGALGEAEALTALIGRRLVQEDAQGGVALLPALREVVYAELPVETQEDLHMQAAQIRAERGEYTAAAFHLQRAGQAEAAVALWYAHREDEIHRGQAAAALAIFEQISLRHLAKARQKELRLLRSELYELGGAPEQVIATLQDAPWDADDDGQVDASLLLGKAHDRQGQGDQALRSYANGLDAASKLQSRMVDLHVQRSLIYLHERDMQEAWQEVNRARYLSENMTGTLHEQTGQLDQATSHYESALAIAQEIGYLAGVARSFHNLGNVASRQRRLDRAIGFYEEAMATHEKMSNRVGLEFARSGIVAPYMQAGRYTEAIAAAERALTFFQAMGNSFWIALNASNLAESHVELGNYAEADGYAQMVLAEEEPHSHPYALFTLGRIRQGQGALEEARFVMDQARRTAEMNEDRYLLAYCWEEIGKIQRAANDPSAAEASFAQALDLFQSLKIEDKVAALRDLVQNGDA